MSRVAQYHEDIQLLQFRSEEIEDRILRGGTLKYEEEQLIHDIEVIEHFVKVENATQLSGFGLDCLAKTLAPGSVSILFRNDHFSTLYKHPQSHQLFTLVTDAGYADHAELVWESLVDVNGSKAEFFAGDFHPVAHAPTGSGSLAGQRTSSNGATYHAATTHEKLSDVSSQHNEQTDADYAYALSLQFQEEARQNEPRNTQRQARRASTPNYSNGAPASRVAHSRSSSNISGGGRYAPTPDRRTGARQVHSSRLTIPPQNDRSTASAVNTSPINLQSVDGGDDAPPPSYEQAARNRAHEHRSGRPSLVDTAPLYTPTSSNFDYGRTQFQHIAGRHSGNIAPPVLPERPREKNKDCVVM
jgi:ubiquitin carboxyl-terminal hydrolase MINDY-1/2